MAHFDVFCAIVVTQSFVNNHNKRVSLSEDEAFICIRKGISQYAVHKPLTVCFLDTIYTENKCCVPKEPI